MFDEASLRRFLVPPDTKVRLKDYATDLRGQDELADLSKDELEAKATNALEETREELSTAQANLYVDNRFAVLVVLQGMDASGKDGTIKHVLSGVNPQGCRVESFKQPTTEEFDHDFLWRYVRRLPERGTIGLFNRSYYEDVLVTRVHPDRLGPGSIDQADEPGFWDGRYESIAALERHLVRNGTVIVKLMLHLSKDEQRQRLLSRLDRPEKRWKFDLGDMTERELWDEYAQAYEEAFFRTSTDEAPWYVLPADYKPIARAIAARILVQTIQSLDLRYPTVAESDQAALDDARKALKKEGD
ncbi:MAG TPA: PPK2 family polyphosphate kinase [Pirellulaceae bacterium]|jgi:PPK2 family polyphosphate:nucleotide phosphotransferase|nr:PPK2 family polyphosphate kinase [Pirellulaceae bacterium]